MFVNERGEVTEGSRTNIFVERDGVWLTPPLSSGVLDGCLRRELIENGPQRVVERVLFPSDLDDGTVWFGNALRGLVRGAASMRRRTRHGACGGGLMMPASCSETRIAAGGLSANHRGRSRSRVPHDASPALRLGDPPVGAPEGLVGAGRRFRSSESSFFPIPPDVMLIPMVLAQRAKAWLIAGVCTIASVAGGFLGYAIGYLLLRDVRASG